MAGRINQDTDQNIDRKVQTEQLEVRDVDSFISYTNQFIVDFTGTVNRLPKVDKNGYSECPFAQNLYVEKDDLLEKLLSKRKEADQYLGLVENEIQRFYNNLNQLNADTRNLNLEKTRDEYITAQKSYKFHDDKYVVRKNDLLDLLKRADKLIQLAQSKQWPLGKPKKNRSYPSQFPAALDRPGKISSPAPINTDNNIPALPASTEIDSLMALGPMR